MKLTRYFHKLKDEKALEVLETYYQFCGDGLATKRRQVEEVLREAGPDYAKKAKIYKVTIEIQEIP